MSKIFLLRCTELMEEFDELEWQFQDYVEEMKNTNMRTGCYICAIDNNAVKYWKSRFRHPYYQRLWKNLESEKKPRFIILGRSGRGYTCLYVTDSLKNISRPKAIVYASCFASDIDKKKLKKFAKDNYLEEYDSDVKGTTSDDEEE